MWLETCTRVEKGSEWRWPKSEEVLRNGFREELPMTDTGHREWLCTLTGSPSCKKNVGPAMGRAIWE